MHSTTFDVGGLGPELVQVRVHHNGDWSGEAIVRWRDPADGTEHEVKLPGSLLIGVGRQIAFAYCRDEVINCLERLDGSDEERAGRGRL